MSGSIPLAISTLTSLIIPEEMNKDYNFKFFITKNNFNNLNTNINIDCILETRNNLIDNYVNNLNF